MADPWNLTLDQSVFEDWNSDSRIIINGNDVSDIRTLINKLDEETGSTAIACEIEHKLSISFSNYVYLHVLNGNFHLKCFP